MTVADNVVTYEAFGAVGDGVTDDLPAICAAHAHANARNLPVRARKDATYHLGSQARTTIIATDTDWNTARFTIDDTRVNTAAGDHKAPLFAVRSQLEPVTLPITRLGRNQRQLDLRPAYACHVLVENDHRLTASGKKPQISPNVALQNSIIVVEDAASSAESANASTPSMHLMPSAITCRSCCSLIS